MKKVYWISFYIMFLGIPSFVLSRIVDVDRKPLIFTIITSLVIGHIVEIWAVRHGKNDRIYIWEYNPRYNLGIKLFNVPIEDSLVFLILTPIFIVYFYEFMKLIV